MSQIEQIAYQLSFEISPIILTGGIAAAIPGGMLPIIAVTSAISFPLGILSGGDVSLDGAFAHFIPLPGASLIDNAIGNYPFANQAIAANAIIKQPLIISMKMIVPAKGYAIKTATMMALQAVLDQHTGLGGTFTVATPSFIYTNCVMTGMRDTSTHETQQLQWSWQLDFVKPLLTLTQAQAAQNALMSKLSSGTSFNGAPAWSGLQPNVGFPPGLAGPSVVTSQSSLAGSGAAAGTTQGFQLAM